MNDEEPEAVDLEAYIKAEFIIRRARTEAMWTLYPERSPYITGNGCEDGQSNPRSL